MIMKNDTNTLYWLVTIGLWIMALIVGSCALVGCGGDPFVLDAPIETQDVAPPDATPDRIVGAPHPDAGADAHVEASPEAGPPDATPEADAEAGCAPPPVVAECIPSGADAGVAFTIPGQFCVWLYPPSLNPPAMPVIMPTPPACACDYTTTCLGPSMCPAGSHYYAGGLQPNGGKIVCQENGDGG